MQGGSAPGTEETLPELRAPSPIREGPDSGLAAVPCPEPHAGLQALGWRLLSPGRPAGHSSGHFWPRGDVCPGAGARFLLRPSPVRAGPKMATRFSVASPVQHGDPLLLGPGRWQPCQALAGMEFPALLAGRVASESYLLCLWHQLASWSRGCVREAGAGTRGLLLGAPSSPARSPARSLWAWPALNGHKAALKPPGSLARGVQAVRTSLQLSPTATVTLRHPLRPAQSWPCPPRGPTLAACGSPCVEPAQWSSLSSRPHKGPKERPGQTGWLRRRSPGACNKGRLSAIDLQRRAPAFQLKLTVQPEGPSTARSPFPVVGAGFNLGETEGVETMVTHGERLR